MSPLTGTVASIAAQPGPHAVRGGCETILLVEDDAKLREAVRAVLAQLGYTVLAAPNGSDALAIWQENHRDIRLLLTDLVMPGGMTGKDLAQRILQDSPALPVIYMGGYHAEVAGNDFLMIEGVNFLAKPFQVHRLAKAVRDCLDMSDLSWTNIE